jgi:hypothetical protein
MNNGSIVMWCQPLVNYYPGTDKPNVASIYINQGWGTSWEEKPATLAIPEWLIQASIKSSVPDWNQWIKLDDPTIWTDENGYFHALAHNGDGPFPCGDGPANNAAHYGKRFRDGNPYPISCSAHLYSENGLDWHMSPVAASNATITLESGASVDLFRQRPKVLTRPAGKGSAITHLFHGSMKCGERPIQGGDFPFNQCTNGTWPGSESTSPSSRSGNGSFGGESSGLGITAPTNMDYSFTTVVPLNTNADSDAAE